MPTLVEGDIVITHKRNKIHSAIRTAGARLLFLPPYSPDFKPIGQALAKLKALMRRAGGRPLEALWRRIGLLLDAFSPAECTNYYRYCGTVPRKSEMLEPQAETQAQCSPRRPLPARPC